METARFSRPLDLLLDMEPLVALLWLGMLSLTIALLILMRTRWGQARPLRKCLALSVLAHVLLAGYATTVHIVTSVPAETAAALTVSLDEAAVADHPREAVATARPKPWESFLHATAIQPEGPKPARVEAETSPHVARRSASEATEPFGEPALDNHALPAAAEPEPGAIQVDDPKTVAATPAKTPEPIDAPDAQGREGRRAEIPDLPEVARRDEREPSRIEPRPARSAGLPSAVLERPLPVPRLAHVPATPQPERALPDVDDSPTKPARGKPAEWPDPVTEATETGEATATSTGGPSFRGGADLKPPSLAAGRLRQTPGAADPTGPGILEIGPAALPRTRIGSPSIEIPAIYRLRTAVDRVQVAQRHGATPESEAAVRAALKWLAENQAADGHWDARTHGAGREQFVAGRDRQGAGSDADTGITGLALLAFLAAGNTHRDGQYQTQVRAGLEYLLKVQARDGNLGGQAATYSFMYCHAMATFAMSEAYGLTGDERLRVPVESAVGYTLRAQDPSGGGWRYRPGDPGDTSQLGWQLMALKSAELAGLSIPDPCWRGASRYLKSASSGRFGGLASYRPVEPVSRAMTAEALVCRVFLGMNPMEATAREAGDYLLGELPGQGPKNYYYWYYATLGMYQLQGPHWQRWNYAMQTTLVASQQKSGPLAGSWPPDTVWGGYGGRVYTTALATLCLEVYYRFLPSYLQASVAHAPDPR